MSPAEPTITAVIPYYCSPRRVIGAVRSLLRQTRPVDRIVVVSDGDAGVPTDRLRRLGGEKVLVHVLPENRGHFFAREVARRAVDDGYILFLDADDEVEREWVQRLLEEAEPNDGVAFCGARLIRSFGPFSRTIKTRGVRLHRVGEPVAVQFAGHQTLYRVDRLAAVGGYDPAFRIGYDTALVNFVAITGPFGAVDEPLYRWRRGDMFAARKQLTADLETGYGSPARALAARRLQEIYERCAPLFRTDPARGLEVLLSMRDEALEREVDARAQELREALAGGGAGPEVRA